MPKSTEEILAHANELAKRFEDYEPAEGDDAKVSPEVLLRLAAMRRSEAEAAIVEAVRTARELHLSWAKIGKSLGTSGQAAIERYSSMV